MARWCAMRRGMPWCWRRWCDADQPLSAFYSSRIWAEHQPTGGARFIFTLPLHAPVHGSAPRSAARQLREDRR